MSQDLCAGQSFKKKNVSGLKAEPLNGNMLSLSTEQDGQQLRRGRMCLVKL